MKNTFTKLFGKPCKILTLGALLINGLVFADGSKDLFPAGTTSFRLMLEPGTFSGATTDTYVQRTEALHYVYANAGETITIATNNIHQGNSWIRLIAPNGNTVVNYLQANYASDPRGRIADRTQELAGPRLSPSDVTANRYLPVYYTVPAGGAGIYKVDMAGPHTNVNAVPSHLADNSDNSGNWQGNLSTRRFIAAWDISVVNSAATAFIPGRVYLYSMRTYTGNNGIGYASNQVKINGILYIRTFDGYTYKVNQNGMNGIYARFFSNKNGIHNPSTNAPTYQSNDATTYNNTTMALHDPDSADTPVHITNKIFYTLPSNDLPATSSGAVPGGSTWMNTPVSSLSVTNLHVEDANGTSGTIGYGGGSIYFDSTGGSNSEVKIESTTNAFPQVVVTGIATAGANHVQWDGRDGAGNPIPQGTNNIKITVTLRSGEVHFPFEDLEFNPNGMIIQQLKPEDVLLGTETIVSDLVYWNDSRITLPSGWTGFSGSTASPVNNSHLPPVNSTGISSSTNGHAWAAGATTENTWGDGNAMDTWAFVQNAQAITTNDIFVPCYNPANTGATGPDTKLGVTLLKRAGADNADNWPMSRKSGHIALESNSRGFVITRVATTAALSNITTPQEGMMVYDGQAKCLKIYTSGAWKCFNQPSCP